MQTLPCRVLSSFGGRSADGTNEKRENIREAFQMNRDIEKTRVILEAEGSKIENGLSRPRSVGLLANFSDWLRDGPTPPQFRRGRGKIPQPDGDEGRRRRPKRSGHLHFSSSFKSYSQSALNSLFSHPPITETEARFVFSSPATVRERPREARDFAASPFIEGVVK